MVNALDICCSISKINTFLAVSHMIKKSKRKKKKLATIVRIFGRLLILYGVLSWVKSCFNVLSKSNLCVSNNAIVSSSEFIFVDFEFGIHGIARYITGATAKCTFFGLEFEFIFECNWEQCKEEEGSSQSEFHCSISAELMLQSKRPLFKCPHAIEKVEK